METINSAIVLLNQGGRGYCDFAGRMFLQSSLLVGLLLLADRCLRARVSARFRYGMWLLVPVKLMLPPTLALPTGLAYWLGRCWPAASVGSEGPIATLSGAVGRYAESFQDIAGLSARATEAVAVRSHFGSLQWPALVLLGWIVGVLLLLALVLWQIVSVRRSLSRRRPSGPRLVALLEECRAELGITTRVGLWLTDEVRSPAVSGSWRPVILLPAGLPSGLSPQGLRTIFTHELAHIKRWDPWVNLAQTALQVAYFWHPLVWAANRKLRYLRELAVDEMVLVTLRSQAQCYADTLIDIAEMAFRKPAFNLRWMGIAESKRTLERRIAHMLNPHTSKRSALGWSGLLTILVLGAVLVPMGRARVAAQATPGVVQSAPALPPGIAALFQLNKDAVLEKFGKPGRIVWQDKTYTLENLPEAYDLVYEGLSLRLRKGAVSEVMLSSPNYVFGNGLHVGDTEAKVSQAFGADSVLRESESESEDFLVYDSPGIGFQISKQDRSVLGIYIVSDYGAGGRAQAYVGASTFAALLPQRIATFNIDTADLKQVLATFGPPVKYGSESQSFSPDQLPKQFAMVYPGGFHVLLSEDHVVELQHEEGSTYVFAGKLHYGSTLEEALAVLGPPVKTVQGQPVDWPNSANVLFRDIDGRKGRDYYHRPDLKVRVWFANDKVTGIYLTRSNYREQPFEPFDAEFARLLQGRVAMLNIVTAGLKEVLGIFGPPRQYVWGQETFQPDALPANCIMVYPDGFRVWLSKGRINEIRHQKPSPYVYRGKLRIGSTLQEALDLLGAPDKTVTGEKTGVFDDRILYRDINGQRGYDYYRRTADQNVVIFFREDKVSAIFMTRSDPDFFIKRAGVPKAGPLSMPAADSRSQTSE